MLIAVNTRLLIRDKLEGIGWFAFESLKRIARQHQEHEFLFIFDRPYSEEFVFSDNIRPVVAGPKTRHAFIWKYWFGRVVPGLLQKHNVDLFLSPDGFLPLRSSVPAVSVIHDLNFEHYPQDVPFFARHFYLRNFPRYARTARRIATVSEYSKNDIVKCYGVEPDKIDVVYNGANESFAPLDTAEQERVRGKYAGGKPYFIYVGSMHPRKNLGRLLQAFDAFKKTSSSPMQLMIVGEKMWWARGLKEAYESMQHRDAVIFTGRMNPDELRAVYASAFALTYVPYFEGFGIPLTEAMYSGIPIITSSVTSMPEVAGDAALLADPFSVNSIADAMLKLASDAALREALIARGKLRKQLFTWQRTADRLWDCIEKSLP
ncbi:MAG: glycosyltransferase family 1 protein [Bacteroidota bacterium]